MDKLYNQLELTTLLKNINTSNQVLCNMIKDNEFKDLMKYNNNQVINVFSNSEINSSESNENEDEDYKTKKAYTLKL